MPPLRLLGVSFLILCAGFGAAQIAVGADSAAPAASKRQLLSNRGFEHSVRGWAGWNASLQRVSHAAAGRYAARITMADRASGRPLAFALSPTPKQVEATTAGATYAATAKVRSNRGTRTICLRIREWDGANVLGSKVACVSAGSAWTAVGPVSYIAAGNHPLDAYVYIQNPRPHDSFDADALSLTVSPAPAPTTTAGTTTSTTTTSPTTTATQPPSTGQCTRVASPGDSVTAFVSSLTAGQTGCLHGGVYTGAVSIRAGGRPGVPVTLTSFPGERARIVGRVVVFDTANDLVFQNLDFDGNGGGNTLPSPTVDGDRVVFAANDVTNDHTAICFDLGSVDGYGTAVDVRITGNRIHDCGKLPAQNHDHGIYVEKTRNAQIVGNTIVRNADRGVQLYPDAQNTLIEHNTIVGNGSGIIISGDLGFATSGTTIRGNVIANSVLRYDVESWWSSGNPVGTGNLVSGNCLWGGAQGTVDGGAGYTVTGTITGDPQFVAASSGDYRLRAGSPCAGLGA
ncbi:MAG: hypothetical protein QOH16_2979 [Gaiellaceae bacterium]|jgi:parallel beta-helix repeat protein|nr:hypothetical protein [Gaiellaceae bacterium]